MLLIKIYQRVYTYNKNVDIKFSTHDAFLD